MVWVHGTAVQGKRKKTCMRGQGRDRVVQAFFVPKQTAENATPMRHPIYLVSSTRLLLTTTTSKLSVRTWQVACRAGESKIANTLSWQTATYELCRASQAMSSRTGELMREYCDISVVSGTTAPGPWDVGSQSDASE